MLVYLIFDSEIFNHSINTQGTLPQTNTCSLYVDLQNNDDGLFDMAQLKTIIQSGVAIESPSQNPR